MNVQALSISPVANSLCVAHFAMIDRLHHAQGDALDVLGFGPRECAFQLISSGPNWRLRAYGGPHAAPLLLMVPAPTKRPCIWDLTPSISAVRYCLHQGFRVHLLEWMPPSPDGSAGLDAYGGRAIAAWQRFRSERTERCHSSWGTRLVVRSRQFIVPWSRDRLRGSYCLEHRCASSRYRVGFETRSSLWLRRSSQKQRSSQDRFCRGSAPSHLPIRSCGQDGWTPLSAWPTMRPWTFTRVLNGGRSTRSRFRASWSIRLSSGFI